MFYRFIFAICTSVLCQLQNCGVRGSLQLSTVIILSLTSCAKNAREKAKFVWKIGLPRFLRTEDIGNSLVFSHLQWRIFFIMLLTNVRVSNWSLNEILIQFLLNNFSKTLIIFLFCHYSDMGFRAIVVFFINGNCTFFRKLFSEWKFSGI